MEKQIVDEQGNFSPAFETDEQAFASAKRVVTDNEQRNQKAAAIERLMNDSQVWPQQSLKSNQVGVIGDFKFEVCS